MSASPKHSLFNRKHDEVSENSSSRTVRRRHSDPTSTFRRTSSCDSRSDIFAELTQKPRFLSVDVSTSLYDACRHLRKYRCHRVPCVDPEEKSSVLIMMTHQDVLRYLVNHMEEKTQTTETSRFDVTLKELNIGSYGNNIHVATSDTPLLTVLELLWYKRISSIPIVDKRTGRVCDLYCKSDVMFLCRINDKYEEHLEMSVANELEMLKTKGVRESKHEGMFTCRPNDTLRTVVRKFVETGAHRMISMDEKTGTCTAVISLSDIFTWIVS